MKKLKIILTVMSFCVILCFSQSTAQEVKNLDLSLNKIGNISKETIVRNKNISSITNGDSSKKFNDLNDKIAMLENKIYNKNSSLESKELVVQLSQLISELKNVIESQKQVSVPNTPSLFSIKAGFMTQVQGQAMQEQTTAAQDANPNYLLHWQRELFIRRIRIMLGGELAKNTTFFFESDAPNLGKVTPTGVKNTQISMYVQDAYVQHTFIPELSVIAGLQLVGITRNGLQSAASLMALDYGAYQFIASTPLDNSVGRDLGINLRGFLFDQRLEYRTGVFSGRNTNMYSPLRFTTRFQYCFKDKEKGFFYTGTTLGKGEILSLGGGIDFQGSYSAYSVDAMSDFSTGSLGSITASGSLSFLNGGGSNTDSTIFTGLIPKQSIVFAELGYFFKDANLQPYVKYDLQKVDATVLKQVGATPATLDLQNKLRSGSRLGFGINYYLSGQNVNFKLLYEVVLRNRASLIPTKTEQASNGMLTLQLQYFTF